MFDSSPTREGRIMIEDIVITGSSVALPTGIGPAAVLNALEKGEQPSKMETFDDREVSVARVEYVDVSAVVERVQATTLDRPTSWAVFCARMAAMRAQLGDEDLKSPRCGVIVGTGLGSLCEGGESSVSRLDRVGHTVARELGVCGCVSTLSQRGISVEAAIEVATNTLLANAADVMIVVGIDEISPATVNLYEAAGFLGRENLTLGEGGACIILERASHAKERSARVHARMTGLSLTGDSAGIHAISISGTGMMRAMTEALDGDTKIDGLVLSGMGAGGKLEQFELKSAKKIVGDDVTYIAPKQMTGEFEASGAMRVAVALEAMVRYKWNRVLCTCIALGGACAAMVLECESISE